jgi:outer membrane protein TolC
VNPNLRLFSLDSLSVEASKNLLRYNYVPKLSLAGDAGYQAIPDDPSYKKFGFSAGLSLDWNIYDGGQRNLKLQQLNIQQETRKFYRSFYGTQYNLQIANLDKKFQSSSSIITQWQDELTEMNKLMLMRREQLVSGQISIIDYLTAMRDYGDVQKKLNSAVIEQQRIINEHNYLVW